MRRSLGWSNAMLFDLGPIYELIHLARPPRQLLEYVGLLENFCIIEDSKLYRLVTCVKYCSISHSNEFIGLANRSVS